MGKRTRCWKSMAMESVIASWHRTRMNRNRISYPKYIPNKYPKRITMNLRRRTTSNDRRATNEILYDMRNYGFTKTAVQSMLVDQRNRLTPDEYASIVAVLQQGNHLVSRSDLLALCELQRLDLESKLHLILRLDWRSFIEIIFKSARKHLYDLCCFVTGSSTPPFCLSLPRTLVLVASCSVIRCTGRLCLDGYVAFSPVVRRIVCCRI